MAGVAIGLSFAFHRVEPGFLTAHRRLNLFGFLGLTVVGMAYQFYPPNAGGLPGASDRTALVSIGSLAGGLLLQVIGLVGQYPAATTLGELMALAGAVLYAYLLVAVFAAR